MNSVLAKKLELALQNASGDGGAAAIPIELILQLVQMVIQLISGGGGGGGGPCNLFSVRDDVRNETNDTLLVRAYEIIRKSDYDGSPAKLAAAIRDVARDATDDEWNALQEEVEAYNNAGGGPTMPGGNTEVVVNRSGAPFAKIIIPLLLIGLFFGSAANVFAGPKEDKRAAAIARITAKIEQAASSQQALVALRKDIAEEAYGKIWDRYAHDTPSRDRLEQEVAEKFRDDPRYRILGSLVEDNPAIASVIEKPLGNIFAAGYDLSTMPEAATPPKKPVLEMISPETWTCGICVNIQGQAESRNDLPYDLRFKKEDGHKAYPVFVLRHADDVEDRQWYHWGISSLSGLTKLWESQGALSLEDTGAIPAAEQEYEELPPGAQPTPRSEVRRILSLLEPKKDEVFVDFGCGFDARFCIEAAKEYGCDAIGVEIDPSRAASARAHVASAGLSDKVKIIEGDATELDITADVGVAYLYPGVLKKLQPKLRKLDRFASYAHKVPGMKMSHYRGAYVWRSPSWLKTQKAKREKEKARVAVWNGYQYTGRICNSPNCRMCNSIQRQLGF